MPAFLIPYVLKGLVAALALAAFLGGVKYLEHRGALAELAKAAAATQAESDRRMASLEQAQALGRQLAAKLSITEKRNGTLRSEVARLSAAADGVACHDADSVRRINQARREAR